MLTRHHALFVILWILIVRLPADAQSKASPPAPPVFSLNLETAKSSVKVGSHVNIGVTLTNQSNHTIMIEHDIGHKGEFQYVVTVLNEDNGEPNKTEYHHALRGEQTANPILIQGSTIELPLEPLKSVVDVIDVSQLYDLNVPGKYVIQVQRTASYSKTVVKSNIITVTVSK